MGIPSCWLQDTSRSEAGRSAAIPAPGSAPPTLPGSDLTRPPLEAAIVTVPELNRLEYLAHKAAFLVANVNKYV